MRACCTAANSSSRCCHVPRNLYLPVAAVDDSTALGIDFIVSCWRTGRKARRLRSLNLERPPT